MRRVVVLLSLVGIVFASGCSGRVKATSPISEEVTWGNYTKVMVATYNGGVAVEKVPGEAVQITGESWARGYTIEEAEQRLDQVEIVATPEEDTLKIEVLAPRDVRRYSGARLQIALPDTCHVHVRTSNGSVNVTDMDSTDIDTSNGAVTVRAIAGDVKAESSNGSLTLEQVKGAVNSVTSNGRITLRKIDGPIEARTSNGRIVAEEINTLDGNVILRSSNGSITAHLPGALSAAVSASTSNGSVNVDLGGVQATNQKVSKRSYKATLNGGEHKLEAVTSNGSIKLKFYQ